MASGAVLGPVWRLHLVLSCPRRHQEPGLTQPSSLGRQHSPDPPPSVLDQNMTSFTWRSPYHMTLSSPNGTFLAPLPSGHGLRWWAVLCKYDLVGVNGDPGCMGLKHVPGLPANNIL